MYNIILRLKYFSILKLLGIKIIFFKSFVLRDSDFKLRILIIILLENVLGVT